MIRRNHLLTMLEQKVIEKRLKSARLSQQDSNRLSRQVRPKLREMCAIDSRRLLMLLDYNQKAGAIERKLKSLILKNIRHVASITLYGSAVYNNHHGNNDIDVIALVRKKSWKRLGEKLMIAKGVAEKSKLDIDLKIYTEEEFAESYPHNITLAYELSDSKTIYGRLPRHGNMEMRKIDLMMKADESRNILWEISENGIEAVGGNRIYGAIRNLIITELAGRGIISNEIMNKALANLMGEETIKNLKAADCQITYKKIGALYLQMMLRRIEKWEKAMR